MLSNHFKRLRRATLGLFFLGLSSWLVACGGSQQQPKVVDLDITAPPADPIADPFAKDTLKGSVERSLQAKIGGAEINIRYYSPAVRGRIIWGGLVPFNQVWVTGAHMASVLSFKQAVKINGQDLPAGTYTLFTIPTPNDWTVIFNKDWEQHLTDNYDPAKDQIRLTVKPQVLPDTLQRFTYSVVAKDGSTGELAIGWEKLKISLAVTAK
jgi:hypothetical protein